MKKKPAKPCNSNEKKARQIQMKKPAKPGDGEEEAGRVHERNCGPAVQQQQQDQREQVVFRNVRLEKRLGHKQVFTINYEKTCIQEKKHLSQLCHGHR